MIAHVLIGALTFVAFAYFAWALWFVFFYMESPLQEAELLHATGAVLASTDVAKAGASAPPAP